MKRHAILIIFPLLFVFLLLTACGVQATGVKHYQRMYTVVEDWNRESVRPRKDLFGYGEYLYNAYLLLFPRKTPTSLTEYYFYWFPLMDVDDYCVCFTCRPEEDDYLAFLAELDAFTITKDGVVHRLVRDEEHFDYPAYIIQWLSPEGKWEVLEYILTDDENHTLVFVYEMMRNLERAEEHSSYHILPNCPLKDVMDESHYNFRAHEDGNKGGCQGFSVYFPDMKGAEYDISFLDLLSSLK